MLIIKFTLYFSSMKKLSYILLGLLVGLMLQCNSPRQKQEKLVVFAASSLSTVMAELADSFTVNQNIEIKFNLGSSGTLARQIEHGAQADVYLSANMNWVNYLDKKSLLSDEYQTTVAYNQLVLVAHLDQAKTTLDSIELGDLIKNKQVAIGDPLHVPAGIYAKQVINYYHLNSGSEFQLLKAKDVRSALTLVELGEAQFGIVYQTDALLSKKVISIYEFPSESHHTIEYGLGLCAANKPAKSFYNYLLKSPKAKAIWLKHGFKL